jgi:hypothetical protein
MKVLFCVMTLVSLSFSSTAVFANGPTRGGQRGPLACGDSVPGFRKPVPFCTSGSLRGGGGQLPLGYTYLAQETLSFSPGSQRDHTAESSVNVPRGCYGVYGQVLNGSESCCLSSRALLRTASNPRACLAQDRNIQTVNAQNNATRGGTGALPNRGSARPTGHR